MIYDILVQKLVDAGIGTAGENLFIDDMGEVDIGVMFKTPLQGVDWNPYIPYYHKSNIQAIVRHKEKIAGEAMASLVMRTVMTEISETHPQTSERGVASIKLIAPRKLPIVFPRLEGNGLEWSLNFFAVFSIQPIEN